MSGRENTLEREGRGIPSLSGAVLGVSGADEEQDCAVSVTTVTAAVAVLLAAWCAAGSLGLMAHPFRPSLCYALLFLAAATIWPCDARRRWWLLGLICLVLAKALTPASGFLDLLLACAAAAILAEVSCGRQRSVLRSCSLAIFMLAVFRLACSSISAIWLLSNTVGESIGNGVGWLLGIRLNLGATFAGVDFLVLMTAFCGGWLLATEGPRWHRAWAAAAAILSAQLVYLVVVAYTLDLAALLPVVPEPTFDHPYVPPPWSWPNAVRQLLPWNLPLLAAGLQVSVVSVMVRWSRWRASGESAADPAGQAGRTLAWRPLLLVAGSCAVAVLLPASATLTLARSDLSGVRFLANQAGNLNWDLPQHDQYGQRSAGGCGMLPHLVASLGGELQLSADLSAADLSTADVVLLVHPTAPLAASFQQRLWDFVRRGGSLLVVAEPYQQQGAVRSGFNDVLAGTAICVERDVAISEAGGWQHSCDLLFHPATYGIGPRNGALFTDTGASLRLRWPARPLVVGRWGWSDPGSDAVLTGVSRFESGERLGDLVLAAEQRVGAGLVAVLGDAYPLSNEGGVRGYEYTGRLLSYLAHRSGSLQAPWRQATTLLLALGLLAFTSWRPAPTHVFGIVVLWALSQTSCEALSRQATRVVPDGRLVRLAGPTSASRLAYIDVAHLSPFSDAAWEFDGINGLALTLMRSGYLTLTAPDASRERLERAAVLVSIAPARRFTALERRELRAWVESGGTFFCLVGGEESAASDTLLADFGFHVSPSPVPTVGRWHEPEPLGHVRAVYWDAQRHGVGDYQAGVQFYAAWPVAVKSTGAEVLVRAPNGQPVVVSRRVGRGRVVVIGDSGFALNKNLEYVGGEPFDGRYENAHFWRWLISRVTDRPAWTPPPPPPPATAETGQEVQP